MKEKNCEKIAKENHVGQRYVTRAADYAEGVDAAEEAVPSTRREILTGEICPIDSAAKAVANATPEERKALANRLRDPDVQWNKKRRERKEETEDDRILQQVVENLRPKVLPKVDENSMLVSLQGVADAMISGCNSCFREFPTLLTEQIYREQVLDILQEPEDYI